MVRSKAGAEDGEFSGSAGIIDAVRRNARVIGQASGPLVDERVAEEIWEIYAVDVNDPTSTPETARVERP